MDTMEAAPASRPFLLVAAVEESAPGIEALRLATRYAGRWRTPVEVHLVHVLRLAAEEGSAEVEKARGWLLRTAEEAQGAAGVKVVPHLLRGDAAEQIQIFVQTRGADLLIVGSHGRTGLRRMVLGSVAERIARTAACPVLIVRPDPAVLTALPDDAASHVLPAVTGSLGGAVAGAALGAVGGPVGVAAGAALGAAGGGALGFAAREGQREADRRDSLLDEVLLPPAGHGPRS